MVVSVTEYSIVVSQPSQGTTSCGTGSFVHCPYCASEDSKVVDSRDSEAGDSIRRRRECLSCERRYTTYERVEEVPLMVGKRDGAVEVFSRQKLLNGMLRAAEKREIPIERLELAVEDIENELRRVSCRRVTTQLVGERALHQLRTIDKVAYIRFASVYRQFDDIEEFQRELARLEEAGADPLPGEEPLPGLDDVDDFLASSVFNGSPERGRAWGEERA
jgi:transcriptional repressor NrdR